MRRLDYIDMLHVDPGAITPVYRQLATVIHQRVAEGKIVKDSILPSLHDMCIKLDISRSSVERAYVLLKRQGVVGSVQGKGYFVK